MAILNVPNQIPQSQPVLDGRGGDETLPKLLHRIYWLFLNSIQSLLVSMASAIDTLQTNVADLLGRDYVLGGTNLTHVNRLLKVSAAATATESAVTDDGTDVALASRGLTLTGDSATVEPTQITIHDTQATTPDRRFRMFNSGNICYLMQNVFLNAAGQFGLDVGARPGLIVAINNNNFSIQTLPAGSATGTAPTSLCQILAASGNTVVLGSLDAASYKVGGVAGESVTLTYGSSLGGVIPLGLTLNTKTVTFTGGIETGHT